MKKQILIISYALLATGLNAAQPPREWGPEQATGAPNTPTAGDIPTAWASLHPDGGTEWLQVEFDKPVEVAEVLIRETFNPGAISKVVAIETDNKETIIWEGQAPSSAAPTEMVVKASSPVSSNKIKIYLDSNRVPGWNEIDAVQLVGKDGSRQWASTATASSFYSNRILDQQNALNYKHKKHTDQIDLENLFKEPLVDASGKPFSAEMLNGKMVGLYFIMNWGPQTISTTAKLMELHKKNRDNFEVILVSFGSNGGGGMTKNNDYALKIMQDFGMTWPLLSSDTDYQVELLNQSKIRGFPSLVVLNKDGYVISKYFGDEIDGLSPDNALETWAKTPIKKTYKTNTTITYIDSYKLEQLIKKINRQEEKIKTLNQVITYLREQDEINLKNFGGVCKSLNSIHDKTDEFENFINSKYPQTQNELLRMKNNIEYLLGEINLIQEKLGMNPVPASVLNQKVNAGP